MYKHKRSVSLVIDGKQITENSFDLVTLPYPFGENHGSPLNNRYYQLVDQDR